LQAAVVSPVLWIRIDFNADLDPNPGRQTNTVPAPGQTLKSQKVEFLHEKYI
jgi:hypothetical protein